MQSNPVGGPRGNEMLRTTKKHVGREPGRQGDREQAFASKGPSPRHPCSQKAFTQDFYQEPCASKFRHESFVKGVPTSSSVQFGARD